MMKLLKYDFKRNGAKLLGIGAVLILAQISMMLFIENTEITLVLSALAYVIAGVILFTTTIRTYSYNIKAYHRKLLPVHTLKSILSPIIMGGICMLILSLVFTIHGFVFLSIQGELEAIKELFRMYPTDTIMSVLSVFWMVVHVLIVIFLAVTISTSIRSKGSFWIGIVAFFLIVNGLAWIENRLFGDSEWGMFRILVGESDTVANGISTKVNSSPVYFSWEFIGTFVFELGCSLAFLYIMVKLIDRKVEA